MSETTELILLGEEAGNDPSLPPLLSDSLIRPDGSALSKLSVKQFNTQDSVSIKGIEFLIVREYTGSNESWKIRLS